MANKRYGRILESAKYYSAIDNYIQYITQASRRGSRVGSGRARQDSIKLYLQPFGQQLDAAQKVIVSAADPTWQRVTAVDAVSSRVSATAPTPAGNILKLAGFKAARVMVVSGRTNTGVAKTSAVTGLKYLSYGGTSTSFPFGRTNAADEQGTAFTAIRTALVSGSTFTNAVYSFQQEVL